MVRFYTDDALGLKISPTVVLVMSLCFIAFVATLDVFGKIYCDKAGGIDRTAFRIEDFDVIQEITWLTKSHRDKEDYENDDFDMREGDAITFIVDGILNIRFSNRVHSMPCVEINDEHLGGFKRERGLKDCPPLEAKGNDICVWKASKLDNYTVSRGYKSIQKDIWPDINEKWKAIWRIKVPQ
ncbi:hypothetical protein PVK06_028904 [Gossypium arboreum]|uniref:Uncharacterized protein n=1 Tax=Gossypium arboreum TaxID=29729 RepID=A0ABR0P592_GOSAR|nr:hypothetical protein PVK06_028904 [Gossypium arboreum]